MSAAAVVAVPIAAVEEGEWYETPGPNQWTSFWISPFYPGVRVIESGRPGKRRWREMTPDEMHVQIWRQLKKQREQNGTSKYSTLRRKVQTTLGYKPKQRKIMGSELESWFANSKNPQRFGPISTRPRGLGDWGYFGRKPYTKAQEAEDNKVALQDSGDRWDWLTGDTATAAINPYKADVNVSNTARLIKEFTDYYDRTEGKMPQTSTWRRWFSSTLGTQQPVDITDYITAVAPLDVIRSKEIEKFEAIGTENKKQLLKEKKAELVKAQENKDAADAKMTLTKPPKGAQKAVTDATAAVAAATADVAAAEAEESGMLRTISGPMNDKEKEKVGSVIRHLMFFRDLLVGNLDNVTGMKNIREKARIKDVNKSPIFYGPKSQLTYQKSTGNISSPAMATAKVSPQNNSFKKMIAKDATYVDLLYNFRIDDPHKTGLFPSKNPHSVDETTLSTDSYNRPLIFSYPGYAALKTILKGRNDTIEIIESILGYARENHREIYNNVLGIYLAATVQVDSHNQQEIIDALSENTKNYKSNIEEKKAELLREEAARKAVELEGMNAAQKAKAEIQTKIEKSQKVVRLIGKLQEEVGAIKGENKPNSANRLQIATEILEEFDELGGITIVIDDENIKVVDTEEAVAFLKKVGALVHTARVLTADSLFERLFANVQAFRGTNSHPLEVYKAAVKHIDAAKEDNIELAKGYIEILKTKNVAINEIKERLVAKGTEIEALMAEAAKADAAHAAAEAAQAAAAPAAATAAAVVGRGLTVEEQSALAAGAAAAAREAEADAELALAAAAVAAAQAERSQLEIELGEQQTALTHIEEEISNANLTDLVKALIHTDMYKKPERIMPKGGAHKSRRAQKTRRRRGRKTRR